jgi:hypothetical protein
MLTVKEWMELVDYRITEGSDYGWMCFGPKAYSLSSWNGEHNGYSFNIVFDNADQTVYTVEVCDYKNDRAYRIINPLFKDAYDGESDDRGVLGNQAWDDVDWIDLESDDDFIQKGLAIRDGEDYDTRVSIPLDLPDDVMFELMKQAHEQDITLNELMEEVVRSAIERVKQDPEAFKEDFADFGKKSPAKMKAKKKKK